MTSRILFSSKNQKWATRWEYFKEIEREFGKFDLDVCAEHETAKCKEYFTEEVNALKQSWYKRCFCNPPYKTKYQRQFVKKAYEEVCVVGNAQSCVLLIPSRTDTKIWQGDDKSGWPGILNIASEIHFVKGRMVFGTDEFWNDEWNRECNINEKGEKVKNGLYHKYGKMNPAQFPSAIILLDQRNLISPMITPFKFSDDFVLKPEIYR